MNLSLSLRKFTSIGLVFILSCEFSEDEKEKKSKIWSGNVETFEKHFRIEQKTSGVEESLLVNKSTEQPYSGLLELNGTNMFNRKSFQKGRLNGPSIKKSEDGSWVEAQYRNGKLHGEMIFYDSKGKVRSIINFEDGELINREKK